MFKYTRLLGGLLFVCLLAGCAQSAPQRIASYPLVAPKEIASTRELVYTGRLEIDVKDASAAAETAVCAAENLEGYLVSTRSWHQGWDKVILIDLAVPSVRFNDLRRQLYHLGTVTDERLEGEEKDASRVYYSHIELQLRQRATPSRVEWQPENGSGWTPWRTFASASRVTGVIFSFVADALIWLLVVGGPLALAAWGVRSLVRRWRKKNQ